jgi:hypothetical protein
MASREPVRLSDMPESGFIFEIDEAGNVPQEPPAPTVMPATV